MELSLIVPCFNEEGNVDAFHDACIDVLLSKTDGLEFVFVDDGSRDQTLSHLRALAKRSPARVQVVRFSRNFGKEAGIFAGLRTCTGDLACIIDADLQQRPEVALTMLTYLHEHPDTDCVTAYQEQRKEGVVLSFFKNTFYKLINALSDVKFISGASDFRMLRRNMIDAILDLPEYFRFSKGLFSFVGFETYFMPYQAQPRYSGASKWSFKKLFGYAVEGIVAFSTAPLRLTTVLGFFFSAASFIYFLVVLIQKLVFGIAIEGYATLVTLILLLGGLQLLALGIIGEYLARNYVETKRRPVFIVKEHIDNQKDAAPPIAGQKDA